MAVPYTFGTATASIPLSNLDSNFATTITLGNTAIQLGNTVTTLNNMTLANVTISGGTSSITSNSISNGTSNVSIATSGGAVTVATNGATAVTVDTSQNVGIGTSSPIRKLTVSTAGTAEFVLQDTSQAANSRNWRLFNASNALFFGTLNDAGTAGNDYLVINSSGNVGIGTTTPTAGYKLNVGSTSSVTTLNGAAITLFTSGGLTSNVGGVLNFRPQLGTTISDIFNLSICAYDHSGDGNADGLSINGSDGVSFSTGGNSRNERMRIDSGGAVFINATSAGSFSAAARLSALGVAGEFTAVFRAPETGNYIVLSCDNPNGQVGKIQTSGSATSFLTSSDYRLKEDIAPMTGALAKVALLKPVTYKWKVDGTDGQGFIAHELQEVVPDCVGGEKDAVDANGNPQYQGVDTSFLVATLTAAIQEQQALITSLTDRIAALEAK